MNENPSALLAKLETYGFQCEGGPLHNCVDWQALRTAVLDRAPVIAEHQAEPGEWLFWGEVRPEIYPRPAEGSAATIIAVAATDEDGRRIVAAHNEAMRAALDSRAQPVAAGEPPKPWENRLPLCPDHVEIIECLKAEVNDWRSRADSRPASGAPDDVAKYAARKFQLGDLVRKTKGSQWHGRVVGQYGTELTPEGYAVESSTERGSVQIYPSAALELVCQAAATEQEE